MITEQFFDVRQAAEVLRVSVSYLHHLTAERKIGFVRLGRRIFLAAEDLENYIKTRRVEPVGVGVVRRTNSQRQVIDVSYELTDDLLLKRQAEQEIARAQIKQLCRENGRQIFKYIDQLTDTGNAERFAVLRGGEVRYCDPWKKWLTWDGKRWRVDEENHILLLSKAVTRQLYIHAAKIENDKQRAAIIEYLLRLEQAGKIKAMLELLKAEVPITPEKLDQDPLLLNLANGVYNLKTGELGGHDPKLNISKLAPVRYDPKAACPLWGAFLKRVMDGDRELIAFLQCAVGYAVTGDISEQVIFLLYGTGANGKSTFVETIAALLGDYALQTPAETLLVKRNEGIPNDIARMKGSRFVYAVESEQSKRMAESLVKQLTGGDTVTARFLHAEFFQFRPECKLFLATNHKPTIRGQDHAIWRRIKLVPFTIKIPEEEQDKHLKEKLRNELPGILNWALEGCDDWQRNGLSYPEAVQTATCEYRDRMDVLADFLYERCETNVQDKSASSELYRAYRTWCEDNGEKSVSQTKFSLMLEERDFHKEHTRNGWKWIGLGLRA